MLALITETIMYILITESDPDRYLWSTYPGILGKWAFLICETWEEHIAWNVLLCVLWHELKVSWLL